MQIVIKTHTKKGDYSHEIKKNQCIIISSSNVSLYSTSFWCSRNRHFREVFQMVAVIPAYEPDAVLTDLV